MSETLSETYRRKNRHQPYDESKKSVGLLHWQVRIVLNDLTARIQRGNVAQTEYIVGSILYWFRHYPLEIASRLDAHSVMHKSSSFGSPRRITPSTLCRICPAAQHSRAKACTRHYTSCLWNIEGSWSLTKTAMVGVLLRDRGVLVWRGTRDEGWSRRGIKAAEALAFVSEQSNASLGNPSTQTSYTNQQTSNSVCNKNYLHLTSLLV